MADELVMPRLSDTMERGTVARWLKAVGDEVHAGDVVAEIETDKATMEYQSDLDGVLLQILVGDGETADLGAVIALVGEPGEEVGGNGGPPAAAPAAAPTEESAEAPAASAPAADRDESADEPAPAAQAAPVAAAASTSPLHRPRAARSRRARSPARSPTRTASTCASWPAAAPGPTAASCAPTSSA